LKLMLLLAFLLLTLDFAAIDTSLKKSRKLFYINRELLSYDIKNAPLWMLIVNYY